MSPDEIESKVKEIICNQLEVSPEQLRPEASFIDDLKADSLAVVELALAFEQEFKITNPEEDPEQIKTVKDATNYIKPHAKCAASAAAGLATVPPSSNEPPCVASSSPVSAWSPRSATISIPRGRRCSQGRAGRLRSPCSTRPTSRPSSGARSRTGTDRSSSTSASSSTSIA